MRKFEVGEMAVVFHPTCGDEKCSLKTYNGTVCEITRFSMLYELLADEHFYEVRLCDGEQGAIAESALRKLRPPEEVNETTEEKELCTG